MRLRVPTVCALVLAAASAVAAPAVAGTSAAATSSAGTQVAPQGFSPPSEVPWGSVGSGWILAQWGAGTPQQVRTVPSYAVLVNQAGQRYVVFRERGVLASAQLTSWSGDGQRALFVTETNSGRTTAEVVTLRTGVVSNSFVIPTSSSVNFQSASFTRPDGYAVLANRYVGSHNQLTRYSFDGQAQVDYPWSFPAVGPFDGSWLSSPDGTEIVVGARHGVAVIANDGTTLSQLPLGASASCSPQRWWSSTIVLASCATGPHQESRLYEFHTGGGRTVALTRSNVPPDDGDLSGWRVSGHVYVEVASACGYVYLARLRGPAPIMVQVPGIPSGRSIYVIGATSSSLALTTSLACRGGPSLLWYTPSSNSSHFVLGPHVSGGSFSSPIVYPSPFG